MSISIYTDASFSKTHSLAVLGYAYIKNEKELLQNENIHIVHCQAINNIRAEIKSALLALENCPQSHDITLYTDCATTCGLLNRREKLERTNYISKAKGVEINNADLYKKFYVLFDQLKPQIIWLKGHMPKADQQLVNKNFSVLDKAVRLKLRSLI